MSKVTKKIRMYDENYNINYIEIVFEKVALVRRSNGKIEYYDVPDNDYVITDREIFKYDSEYGIPTNDMLVCYFNEQEPKPIIVR